MKQIIWSSLSDAEKRTILLRPANTNDASIATSVRTIIDSIRARGDGAVADYTRQFDGVDITQFKVSAEEFNTAEQTMEPKAKAAINQAYDNITTFHTQQGFKPYKIETTNGVKCERIVQPIDSIGLYVPGGTAPLISTTLMIGIPSQLAKCPKRVLCTPSNKQGAINPNILYAAKLCGITDIFKIGGAQAIAAMAYGTANVPKVSKIFGPGNAYVTAAKKMVAEDAFGAAMDMPAGPSEVCVIADDSTNPEFAAADLLAQAEHDPLSQVVLIALSQTKASAIQAEVQAQLNGLSRKDIAAQALEKSLTILVDDMATALHVSNLYAPEHLI